MARMTDTSERTGLDVQEEVTAWLKENWDPGLTVGEWWERLGLSGWAAPSWPEEWYGKGLSPRDSVTVQRTIAEFGALGAPGGLGLLLAGPTIIAHGTDEQKERYLRDIVTGQKAWCQLFSEPAAGSDLAGLQTRAVKDGEEWVVNGQKVWTSGGQVADLGMLIARTDPDLPKHQGITYFALEMRQDGIDVRPLREMTGRALFNEVFLTDARVSDDAIIGGVNNGWAVANSTLAFERAGLGAGGGTAAASPAHPGSVAGNLTKQTSEFMGDRNIGRGGNAGGMFGAAERMLVKRARENGAVNQGTVRQELALLHTYNEIARYTGLRQKAMRAAGQDLPGAGNLAKLSMSQIVRLVRDLGPRVFGPVATLHAYTPEQRREITEATGDEAVALITEMVLFAPGPSIYGGTDQVQRNIIGERVLGLPKEPGNERTVPFRELAKNG
jgi:alkylation response protein AidB-like acyl-CoA dehydrogenase